MTNAATKWLVGLGALTTTALLAGCSLPASNVTVGAADNGHTLNVGVGSTINLTLPGYSVPVSSNPKVLSVSGACAGGGPTGGGTGGGIIVGCFWWATANTNGTATLSANGFPPVPCPPGALCAVFHWQVTVNVWPNPTGVSGTTYSVSSGGPCCRPPVTAPVSAPVVVTQAGHQVATTHSDAQGHFAVALSPGTYTLSIDTGPVHICQSTPATVTVVAQQVVSNVTLTERCLYP